MAVCGFRRRRSFFPCWIVLSVAQFEKSIDSFPLKERGKFFSAVSAIFTIMFAKYRTAVRAAAAAFDTGKIHGEQETDDEDDQKDDPSSWDPQRYDKIASKWAEQGDNTKSGCQLTIFHMSLQHCFSFFFVFLMGLFSLFFDFRLFFGCAFLCKRCAAERALLVVHLEDFSAFFTNVHYWFPFILVDWYICPFPFSASSQENFFCTVLLIWHTSAFRAMHTKLTFLRSARTQFSVSATAATPRSWKSFWTGLQKQATTVKQSHLRKEQILTESAQFYCIIYRLSEVAPCVPLLQGATYSSIHHWIAHQ